MGEGKEALDSHNSKKRGKDSNMAEPGAMEKWVSIERNTNGGRKTRVGDQTFGGMRTKES